MDSFLRPEQKKLEPPPTTNIMEAVDWENSSGGSSDTEAYLQDTKYEDDEELHFTSGFISKLQFRKDKSRAHWINEMEWLRL
ncbi:hypothetical protein CMV_023776 [Castanea mollissima]|uniref:Uncharacterized protein n=1 Tax=Castanea mollissima TaxID=60419 RepID=A0A8J4VIK9_9ROSI|nr:hypothetical protein CMV_023776 [Castanea mollissima]